MQIKKLEIEEVYDGSQLRSHFSYLEHGILGTSLVYWFGPCDVSFEHMVDGEDLLQQNAIRSDQMMHVIVEVFDQSLFAMATFQRVMSSVLADMTVARLYELGVSVSVKRDGDDVFVDGRKFNVSIATKSPISTMIHFGLNITGTGVPVPCFCLQELKWDPEDFAEDFASRVVSEYEGLTRATQKVRAVN